MPALSMSLDRYMNTYGSYPFDLPYRTWDQQLIDADCVYLINPNEVRATFADMGFDEPTGRILDRWGSPIRMVPAPAIGAAIQPPILYSLGPDGIDDGGKGDDLRCEQRVLYCNDGYHWKATWPAARLRTLALGIMLGLIYVPALFYYRALRRRAISVTLLVLAASYIAVHGLWFPSGTYIIAGSFSVVYAWLVIILVSLFTYIRWRYRIARQQSRINASLCPACAYPTEGLLPGRPCPECGACSTPLPS